MLKQNAKSIMKDAPALLREIISLSFRRLGKLLTLFALVQAPAFSAGLILGFLQAPKVLIVLGVIYGLLAGPILVGSGIFIVAGQSCQTGRTLASALEAALRRYRQFLALWLVGLCMALLCAGPGLLVGVLQTTSAPPTGLPVATTRNVEELAQPLLFVCGTVVFLWLASVYAAAVPALFLEGLDTLTALRRARELSRGLRWRIACVVLGLVTIAFLLHVVLALVALTVSAIPIAETRSSVLVALIFVRGLLVYVLVSAGCVSLYQLLVAYQKLVARERGANAT